jgi:hypothetical protein
MVVCVNQYQVGIFIVNKKGFDKKAIENPAPGRVV